MGRNTRRVPILRDGNIDVKFINILPFDDFEEIREEMSREQVDYLYSLATPAEGPVTPVKVDYSLEDFHDWGWGIDAFKFMDRMKEKYLKQ